MKCAADLHYVYKMNGNMLEVLLITLNVNLSNACRITTFPSVVYLVLSAN